MGFLETIKNNYGEDTQRKMKVWGSTNRQLAHFENHKKFLLQCRQQQVIPFHLNNSFNILQFLINDDNPIKEKYNQFLKQYKYKILSIEISYVHWKVMDLKKRLEFSKNFCSEALPNHIYQSYSHSQTIFFEKEYTKIKIQQKKKLKQLISIQRGLEDFQDNKKWFYNASNKKIPQDVECFLSLGENFNLPYDKHTIPLEQLLVDVEYLVQNSNQETIHDKRNKSINIITNHLNSLNNHNISHNPFHKIQKKTKIFLKKNPDILITRADKGNVIVALNKDDYQNKTNALLSDERTYQLVKSDPTTTIQNKLNKIIKSLATSNVFSKEEVKSLKCENGVFPKLYCLPKIHKENLPLRPIVSFIGSPTYKVSKYLSNFLKHAFQLDSYHTKNSFELVAELQGVIIPENYILVSLDVVSLFTNIPTDLTIELVTERWQLIQDHCKLNLAQFLELLKFVFSNNYFKFEDRFFKQVDGLGMGNCLSPICSDIVMSELQNSCLQKLSFKPPFYKRYVDDIVTCIPKDQIDIVLNTFNKFHPKLQFTIEVETNQQLPFLDVLLIRNSHNHIITDWYHKPTFSGRFLNFNSQHTFNQKLNVINILKTRALRLSHRKFWDKNLQQIKKYLIINNFPMKLTNKLLKLTSRDQQLLTTGTEAPDMPTANKKENGIISDHNDHNNNNNNNKKYFKIPYIKGLSEKIARIFNNDEMKVAFGNENNIRKLHLTKTKSKTPKELESNVIYRIPCLECSDAYLGQTSRYLKIRINEHKRSIKHNNNSSQNRTALAEHSITKCHYPDFTNTAIVGKQSNLSKRLFHEMLCIKKEKRPMNKREDTQHLSTSYFSLIDRIT